MVSPYSPINQSGTLYQPLKDLIQNQIDSKKQYSMIHIFIEQGLSACQHDYFRIYTKLLHAHSRASHSGE